MVSAVHQLRESCKSPEKENVLFTDEKVEVLRLAKVV